MISVISNNGPPEQNTNSYCTRLMNNMLQLLVVALLASGVVAEVAEKAVPVDAQPADSPSVTKDAVSAEQRMSMPGMSTRDQYDHDDRNDHLYLKAKLDGHRPEGPLIARTLHSSIGHGPNIAAQDEIIRFTYSPAYYEPIWVLDYRFLKSGGRRYTRGPGGQILILPRSYKHKKGDGTHDYDSMIEHLRLKLIAEQNQRMREHGFNHHNDHGHRNEYEPAHHREQEPIHHREQPMHHREQPIHHLEQPIHYREQPIHHNGYEPVQHYDHEALREREHIERDRPMPFEKRRYHD